MDVRVSRVVTILTSLWVFDKLTKKKFSRRKDVLPVDVVCEFVKR